MIARISADTRYKLYINGNLVSIGPCKGNLWTTYYETVDLSRYILKGSNVITAEVLHFSSDIAYDDSHWSIAEVITSSFIDKKSSSFGGELTPWILKERPIPQLSRVTRNFKGVSKNRL